jgi:7,8-dihydropterin-6-yl-methyl-4-(beta-D-ribofuranosyl)aminobenzene 5'-phosphate synthase
MQSMITMWEGGAMERRRFLKLGMVMGGTIVLGDVHRFGQSLASAAGMAIPTVDQLVMTSVVDNIYDVFTKGGKMGDVMVQRTPLPWPVGSRPMLLTEHGLAYHLASVRGAERKEILLDFAWTMQSLTTNYPVLKVDPTTADALIVSHGHGDHYGALPDLAQTLQGRMKPGLTLYAGGEDTFCHRWVVTPDGQKVDYGQLNRAELEARDSRSSWPRSPLWWRATLSPPARFRGSPTSRSPLRRGAWRPDRQVLVARPPYTSRRGRCRWKRSPASWCQTFSGVSTRPPIMSRIGDW